MEQKSVDIIIISKNEFEEGMDRVETFRDGIHKEYDGTVLCKEVRPDPPVRGPNGYAFIPLVEGAAPQRSKPFRKFGVREEALRKITQE